MRNCEEKASWCESGLLGTLLNVAPEAITQQDFDNYIDAVHEIRWIIHGQLRSYTEPVMRGFLKPGRSQKKARKEKAKNGTAAGVAVRSLTTHDLDEATKRSRTV